MPEPGVHFVLTKAQERELQCGRLDQHGRSARYGRIKQRGDENQLGEEDSAHRGALHSGQTVL
jgi:hypothetical protein